MAQPTLPSPGTQGLDFEQFWTLFKKSLKWILPVSLLAAVGGYGWVYSGGPSYEAQATLLLTVQDPRANSVASLLGTQGPSPLKVLTGVLKSKTAEDRIVKKTNLPRKIIRDFMEVKEDSGANQIVIRMNWKPNDKAVEVVAAAVDTLRDLDREIGFSVASKTAANLRAGIATKSEQLRKAERALADFQKSMKTTVVPISPGLDSNSGDAKPVATAPALYYQQQVKDLEFKVASVDKELATALQISEEAVRSGFKTPTLIPSVETWRAELVKKQFELKLAETAYGPKATEVVRLKREIEVTESQLRKEAENYLKSVTDGIDPNIAKLRADRAMLAWQLDYLRPLAAAAPEEAMQLKRLTAEVAALQQVVATLRAKYEEARIQADVDQIRWSLLDPPAKDELPSGYRPVRAAGMYGLTAFIVSLFVMLLRDRNRRVRNAKGAIG